MVKPEHKIQAKPSLFFLCLLLTACSRSASPATRIPQVVTLPPQILPTQALPVTEIPVFTPTETTVSPATPVAVVIPTAVVISGSEPTMAPDNASRLAQTLSVSYENPSRVVWSQDGKQLALQTATGLVALDGESLNLISQVEIAQPMVLLDFSPTSGKMATTSDQQLVEIRDIATGGVVNSLQLAEPAITASFSTDGKVLAVCMADKIEVQLWNVETGQYFQRIVGFGTAAPVYTTFFSPDGQYLIWMARGTVMMENLSNWYYPNLEHEDFVTAAALSPDNSILATVAGGTYKGNFQPLLKLWDPFTGAEYAVLPAGSNNVNSLSFSPDGKLLASNDGALLTLWDVQDGQQIGAVSGHEDGINSVAFSPDGLRIATASSDGTVRMWQVTP